MRKHVLGALVGLIAVVLAVSGCTSSHENSSSAMDDRMFLTMMIPHHQQAIEMSDLVLATTTNAELKALAQEIKSAQGPEIEQMKAWLGSEGMEEDHSGHMADDGDMQGMLDEQQMNALKSATGVQRDRLFVEGMIAHHEGAIVMAEGVIANGSNPEVKALAEQIITAQRAEIATMKQMLQQLS